MSRVPSLATVAAFFALALGTLNLAGPARGQGGGEDAQPRQILVMLKMPAPHFRPNSSYGGDYDDRAGLNARRRVAAAIARRAGLTVSDNWAMPLIGVDCFVMAVPASLSLDEAVSRVSAQDQVAWSQPINVYRTQSGRNGAGDPLLAVQPAAVVWQLPALHRIATGRGVKVAVIDSKIDVRHPDLAGQFIADRDFMALKAKAAEKHGTGIAGVIGAKAGNGLGIAGIAPGSRLMALRACAEARKSTSAGGALCNTLSLAKALHFAIERGAQVINLSLSGPHDRLLESLIAVALQRNASIVAAFDPALRRGGFPASHPGVVAVANESLRTYPATVYGAPGRDIPTTQPGGDWYLVNGNSYAAAHVSGLMALLREQRGAKALRSPLARRGGGIDACAALVPTSRVCECRCAIARLARTTSPR